MHEPKDHAIDALIALTTIVAGLLIFLMISVKRAEAATWLVEQPIRNRSADVTWSQDGTCDQALLERAGAMLDFYLLTPFAIRPVDRSAHVTATCPPILQFMRRTGLSFQHGGVARVYRTGSLITNTEITYNGNRQSLGTAMHEMLHALGMGHSDVPDALLCAPPASCNQGRARLAADDLVGLASLYEVPANCTPQVSDDRAVYFPFWEGEWVEWRPLDATNLAFGFEETGRGPSIDYDWQCDLFVHGEELSASVYFRGRVLEVELVRDGGIWRLAR